MTTGKMSPSEAGKLGYLKSKGKIYEHWHRLRKAYRKNPKKCQGCQKILSYESRRDTFCSHSCAAVFRNRKIKGRHKKPMGRCLNCDKVLTEHRKKYCSNKCQNEYQYKQFVERWLAGKESGIRSGGLGSSAYIRRWLIERSGHRCNICGNTQWMGHLIPLILDHIDGNGLNNKYTNVRMVCGNCDMLLPTFAGRNRGKGRQARKVYDDRRTRVFAAQA